MVAQRLQRVVCVSFWLSSPERVTAAKPRSSNMAERWRTLSRVLQKMMAEGLSKCRRILTIAWTRSLAITRITRYSISA